MIGTFSTAGFTREAWIEKRVAEGFTKEQAEHEFDSYTDPEKAGRLADELQEVGALSDADHVRLACNGL